MKNSTFDSFVKMIEEIPPEGVIRAVELQCKMLRDDLANRRVEMIDDVLSIQSFHSFLQQAGGERGTAAVVFLPVMHEQFYRKTVERLVNAEILPADAMALFDKIFSVRKLEMV